MNPGQVAISIWVAGAGLVTIYGVVRYHYRLGAGLPVNSIDDGMGYAMMGVFWPLGALYLIGYALLYPVRALGRRRARRTAQSEQFYPGAWE